MTVRVQDFRGNEIKVGMTIHYGGEAGQPAEVVEISEPDVVYNPATDADDGGYAVEITVRFPDGAKETMKAFYASPGYAFDPPDDYEEVFEEGGDIEVPVSAS